MTSREVWKWEEIIQIFFFRVTDDGLLVPTGEALAKWYQLITVPGGAAENNLRLCYIRKMHTYNKMMYLEPFIFTL